VVHVLTLAFHLMFDCWWRQQIVPQAKAVSYKLPTDCPLHSSRDRYLFQVSASSQSCSLLCRACLSISCFGSCQDDHANKKRSLWSCGFCHKQFRTRGYLDQHFDRKHMHDVDDVREATNAAVCKLP